MVWEINFKVLATRLTRIIFIQIQHQYYSTTLHKSVIVALRKLVILFVTMEDNRWIQYSLVLFVLGDGPEKVWIVIPIVA